MILIGDLHGEYVNILYKINKLGITNTTFIQVGDFGLGFHDLHHDIKTLTGINKFLQEKGNSLYLIRGNHDNPFFWNQRKNIEMKNIFFVQDYEVVTIEDQKILFIGGGISIDRKNRTVGKDYWVDEAFILNPALLDNACATGIDTLVVSNGITGIIISLWQKKKKGCCFVASILERCTSRLFNNFLL